MDSLIRKLRESTPITRLLLVVDEVGYLLIGNREAPSSFSFCPRAQLNYHYFQEEP